MLLLNDSISNLIPTDQIIELWDKFNSNDKPFLWSTLHNAQMSQTDGLSVSRLSN